ncbi:hypothetical protein EGI22_09940 [Lacihabitans sp. LS3-19]|uniref:DUF1801 domain-containing protein n=1 Tax=Lacihabitans sp. LS3-19 TaxID=2487335 RepID=UPI0020CD6C1E|nr:DUF1801 domain-containing protein [Lacihabitans sp. LS3-19]MCP9768232.1 hypothetical protein [Lacihabitans sp. LS3-19]
MNPKVDVFFNNLEKWQTELELLRAIILDCGLNEELKWGVPTYTFQKNNILLLGGFKEYFTLSFFKGVLLNDGEGLLSKPGENSQSVRMFKFTDIKQIEKLKVSIKTYIFEALEIEKANLKVDLSESKVLVFPDELLLKFEENPAFQQAFEALTIGRQRAYNMFFSAAKQSQSRTARIEKYTQRIFDKKGINDCICGFSKKMPGCDGSHKFI